MKSGGDSIEKIEEAIDYVNNQLSLSETNVPAMGSPATGDSVHGTPVAHDQSTGDHKLYKSSGQDEVQIPSELIARCVATLLMIQVNFTVYKAFKIGNFISCKLQLLYLL